MRTDQTRILLILPEDDWTYDVHQHLIQYGFLIARAPAETRAALSALQKIAPKLVVIDLGQRHWNLIALCHEIHSIHPSTRIVGVVRDEEGASLELLQAGIIGCIHYSYPLEHWPALLEYMKDGGAILDGNSFSRLLANNRRFAVQDSLLEIGELRINLTRHIVTLCNQRVFLTPREFTLLACLAKNADSIVTFDELLSQAWGYQSDLGERSQVRLYVARLRQKFSRNAASPDFILTERGIGYILNSHNLLNTDTMHFSQRLATNRPHLAIGGLMLSQPYVLNSAARMFSVKVKASSGFLAKKAHHEAEETGSQLHRHSLHHFTFEIDSLHMDWFHRLEEWAMHHVDRLALLNEALFAPQLAEMLTSNTANFAAVAMFLLAYVL